MAAISAAQVKELREKTGVGMMECKKALTESDGDVEKAVDLLRKRGAAVAAKRAGQEAKEGKVTFAEDDNKLAAVEIRCETDFVANGEDFTGFANLVAKSILLNDVKTNEELFATETDGVTLESANQSLVAKITEKIEVANFQAFDKAEGTTLASYSHLGGKIGVVVKLTSTGTAKEGVLEGLAKDLAMQVAAAAPKAVRADEVPAEVIEREKAIYAELAVAAGTKAEFVDRQIEGKVNKFLKEVTLEEQMFIKDTKKSIKALVKEIGAEAGVEGLKIDSFIRFELGA